MTEVTSGIQSKIYIKISYSKIVLVWKKKYFALFYVAHHCAIYYCIICKGCCAIFAKAIFYEICSNFQLIVFQFQHFGCFGPVVKHQKCNLKASKSTFESIKSNKQSNLMPYSLFFEKILTFQSNFDLIN